MELTLSESVELIDGAIMNGNNIAAQYRKKAIAYSMNVDFLNDPATKDLIKQNQLAAFRRGLSQITRAR